MIITVPCTWFIGTAKRKNYLNLNVYRNCYFHSLNNAKKSYKMEIKKDVLKLPMYKKIKPVYRYYLPRKCDIGNVHAVLEKFFLDALVEFDRLEDDNCHQVIGADYEFVKMDKNQPRCEIEIRELG
jgi:hypothetical protein